MSMEMVLAVLSILMLGLLACGFVLCVWSLCRVSTLRDVAEERLLAKLHASCGKEGSHVEEGM
ncbi:hypothetical protein [Bifidobacterium aerophilum]|uniref:Uncharacterized protein n=1 Tax=Bifidobacterium aerophilum TaxID=1798155 RepID=A0A6N9Z6S7_9BIFI|nr:hypothetical protein [Bifidobacterium aerophilum]NEG89813.1 hypothetical protein [Bifidobacterium aerophilum]